MAAIRMFFSYLTEKGILAMNPPGRSKPKNSPVPRAKHRPSLPEQVRTLLKSIDTSHPVGHRDKALLATLAYTCSRISAVVKLRVEDYFQNGTQSFLRLQTKGGKEILQAYLSAAKLRASPSGPLFPTTVGKSRKLGTRPMTRIDGANLLKRRLKNIGMVGQYSPHSFRATGITRFLEEGGTLEAAQHMADHADSRTTKLYDRRGQKILREDVERIRY
jgi:site-specific recombinase XerD